MKAKLLLIMSLLLIAGCSTNAIKQSEAVSILDERISYPLPVDGAPYGTLTFVRDSGIYASGAYLTLLIDGTQVAMFYPEESATIRVPTGNRRLTLQLADRVSSLTVAVKDQTHQVFRLMIPSAFAVGIAPAPIESGTPSPTANKLNQERL